MVVILSNAFVMRFTYYLYDIYCLLDNINICYECTH